MSYSNQEKWYRQMITDHYQYPKNKGLIKDDNAKIIHLKNPSCGDDLMLQGKVVDNKVMNLHFEGTGCAICCSSASMLTQNLNGKTVQEAEVIIENFLAMVQGKEDVNEDVLEDAVALKGVAKLPPRIKCATLVYKAAEKLLHNKDVNDDDIEEVTK